MYQSHFDTYTHFYKNPEELKKSIEGLKLGTSSIEALDLDFTLPGRPDWELKVEILVAF